MSGIKYLLDTNYILGILKSSPTVLEEVSARRILTGECAYSAITKMELLGFPGITRAESDLIRKKLTALAHMPLTIPIEEAVIDLRQTRKIKLPDAIIAGTALSHGLELLTFDQHLAAVMHAAIGSC
jgi:predicted nucleic acid-binding protein